MSLVEEAKPMKGDDLSREPLLTLEGVTLQYKTREHVVTATYKVDFQIFPLDRFVVLGPSGCGKTSILKAVGGFLEPAAGKISLKGKQITKPGPDRMFVFQEFDQLLPWKTVKGNIMFALTASDKMSQRDAEERAQVYIEMVNLDKFADSYPHMLSGGMKQRVAIARAMATEADILLLDEPFAALDAMTRRKMQEELLRLWDKCRFTVLFVTHSIEEAVIIGNRVLMFSPRPGQVRAEFDCEMLGHEHTEDEEFRKTCEEIRNMLFSERVEEVDRRVEE
jgi:NitT/TauT family transport system ATP-binding protein